MNFIETPCVTFSDSTVMKPTLKHPRVSDVTKWEHQLFDGLTESQRLWLSDRVTLRTYTAKSIVFQPSDPTNHIYLILDGKVKIEILSGRKDWLIREILSKEDWFGLHGLFGQTERREYARVLRSKAQVAIFEKNDFQRLMEVNFDFAEKVLTLTAQKAIAVEQRSLDMTTMSALSRLARFLLKQIEKEGVEDAKGWFYNSQITQEEIGAYIGTGRQTVTEILGELAAKNILTYNWGKFWVHDLGGLRMQNAK